MSYSREICVPRVEGGVLYYTLMEVQAGPTDAGGNYWAVKYKVDKQTQPPVPITTSAVPGTPITTTSF
jgi:hypothetical protein